MSATHDQDEILQAVIDAAVRLLGATGAMIDLVGDTGMAEAWTNREVGVRASANIDLLQRGQPRARRRRVRPRDPDPPGRMDRRLPRRHRFTHTAARDAFVRESGIQSVIAAPLVHREVVVGAITVYGDRARRLRRRGRGAAGGARRPGRRRDRQRPPHRRARAIAGGGRPARRLGADPARDRGPRLGHPRAGRGPPADRRRGDPPARVGRRPDRPVRPGDRRPALVVRRGRRDGRRSPNGP